MKLSLRAKLPLLVACAVSFAAVPIILVSRSSLLESAIQKEQDAFVNTVRLVEDSLSVRYLHLLTSEVESVLEVKQGMRQMASLVSQMSAKASSSAWAKEFGLWQDILAEHGTHLALYDRDGQPLLHDRYVDSLMTADQLDFKGQSMRSLLQSKSHSSKTQFAVTQLSDKDGHNVPILVCFYPLKDGTILVLSEPLAQAEEERKALENRMVSEIQEKLDEIVLSEGATLAVIDGQGRRLASAGKEFSLELLTEEARERARSGEHLQGEISGPYGDMLYRLAYFKALDWYVAAAVPMEAITSPAEELAGHLFGIAAGMLMLSLLTMIPLTVRTLGPLRLLTQKAQELAEEDFSSELGSGFADRLAENLPVRREDEVGQLAGAFDHMVHALDENIHRLVDTLAVRQRMQGELNAARDIQMGILPPADGAPRCEGYRAAAFLEPAKEVGGDFYDFFTAPDGRQAVVIGDVSDKGVSAALFMSMAVTLVRYTVMEGLSCEEAMRRVNERLAANNPSCMFVTLFIGLFDPVSGHLEYANGAHCPPFVVSPDASVPVRALTDVSGPLVGAMEGMDFELCHAELAPGEYCLLYTDGVSEAMDETLQLFSEGQIASVLDGLRLSEPEEVLEEMMAAVIRHRGKAAQSDDITMLCFKRVG